MTRFTTQIASDLIRDGLGVEPLDPASEVIAEIFRSDANHTVTLNIFANDVPLYAIEQLIERARRTSPVRGRDGFERCGRCRGATI